MGTELGSAILIPHSLWKMSLCNFPILPNSIIYSSLEKDVLFVSPLQMSGYLRIQKLYHIALPIDKSEKLYSLSDSVYVCVCKTFKD